MNENEQKPTAVVDSTRLVGVRWSHCNRDVEIVWVKGVSKTMNDEDTPPDKILYVCEVVNSSEICFRGANDLRPLETKDDWVRYKRARAIAEHGKAIRSAEYYRQEAAEYASTPTTKVSHDE